jgi:SAM-dependent methyltransferase
LLASRAATGRFLGYVPDAQLVELYRSCALFAFPSSNEGFGLPPLEAMVRGAPVIAAARASLVEVVAMEEALFDPDDIPAFAALIARALTDPGLRERLVRNATERSRVFSWERTAAKTLEAIKRVAPPHPGVSGDDTRRGRFDRAELVRRIAAVEDETEPDDQELMEIASTISSNAGVLDRVMEWDRRVASRRGRTFLEPDGFETFPAFDAKEPRVFGSTLCRAQHFRMPLYSYWCEALGEKPRFHRKQWEFVYICQVLAERGMLAHGRRAIGFGVGKEPLVSLFASRGVSVLASDLDIENARRLGWVSSNQHSAGLAGLNERGLCGAAEFERLVSFRNIDMKHIPPDVGRFDFCWSSCAFEHLGSIRNGLEFVKNSVRILNPGGLAVHTTEFNLTSNDRTLDNDEAFVIFRRRDIEALVAELEAEGFRVEPIDFAAGSDRLERYVDLPPYVDDPHLRLQLAGDYVSTSIGLIIGRPL